LTAHAGFEYFICDYDGKQVEIFQIPAAGTIPVAFENEEYIRIGSHLTLLKKYPDLLRSILNSHIDWSAQVNTNASIEDLDANAISLARRKFSDKSINKTFYKDIANWTDIQLLDKMRITINEKITNAALILLGKPEAAHLLSPHVAQITWKLDTEEKAYEHFGMPLFLEVNSVLAKIRNVVCKFFPDNQLVSVEVMKYDSEVILEALNNCIAHQDYRRNERIVVVEKINKIEFINGGSFFEGNAIDYSAGTITPRNYRNKWLAEAMVNLGMIDALGYGIHKMFNSQRNRFFPLPDYTKSSHSEVILEIYGHTIDENYSKTLIERKYELSLDEVILLDKVQKQQPVNDDDAKMLKKKNLIEGRKPNFYIGAKIAKTTGHKAEYTKNKGLDKQYYLDLIIKAIEQHENVSRKDIDALLWNKLPEILDEKQKKNRITNLIKELRMNGKIVNCGNDRKPIWELKEQEE
jgi:ATP-dependent DNA helicase RecG